ncbi:MAG: T9SS type A sorting domain-containing protein [Flavobacteriales bacterium]|nr:T9SS type A sorting domain-containing protein [Flavobacteriales bacterium]
MTQQNYAIALGGLLSALMVGRPVQAQVSLYEFEESVGTYTEISEADGGVSLGVPTYWPQVFNNRAWVNNPFNDPDGQVTQSGYFSPAIGPGYPIGFDFTFNGDVFDRIGISNGGWISFGKSTDALQAVWVYNDRGTVQADPLIQWYNGPEPTYKRNRVAGFGNSGLQLVNWTSLVPPGPYSNIRVATIGTAPNRVCVVQWKDFGLFNDVTVSINKINFQIRLNEADNSVEVVYGHMDWVSDLGRYVRTQVGLSGRTNADFNGRMTVFEEPAFLHDWNQTVPMDTMLAYCEFAAPEPGQPDGSGVPPVEGLTFRWTPQACPPPAWPFVINTLDFNAASVSWDPNGSEAYDFLVSTVNDPNGPEVASGTVTDPEAFIEGLEPTTAYFIFVRSYCDGAPGGWSLGTPFTTRGGGFLSCPGTPTESTICSAQFSTYTWHYVSEDGFSPVKIDFLGGLVGSVSGESFGIWNGNAPVGAAAFSPTGDLTGVTYTSVGPEIFIQLTTDAGACEAQPWYLPIEWRVGCKNCTDPLVTFTAGDVNCDEDEFFVGVNVFSMGTATSLNVVNSQQISIPAVTTTGLHQVGPFEAGTSVIVTMENAANATCSMISVPMINMPCATADCGPTEYTLCYADNDWAQRAYTSTGGQEIGIRFIEGSVGMGDFARTYNGADPNSATSTALPSSLINVLRTSGTPNTDHTLVLEVVADNAQSCADPDTLFGASAEWRYVVGCYDGCTQPTATFATNCLSGTQFEVNVTLTAMGSGGNVNITNNGGAANVPASQVGTYTVGPFTTGSPVTIEVEGASTLCSWTSYAMNPDCFVGVEEVDRSRLQLFPNPNDGVFRVELPNGITGRTELQVLDMSGRMVAQQITATTTGAITMDLANLPSGLYTVWAIGNGERIHARVSIQH